MKAPARILTLVLAYIFAIPNQFPKKLESMEFISSAWAVPKTEEECRNARGWEWETDEGSGRCVVLQQNIKTGARARECDKINDQQRRNDCFREAALEGAAESNIGDTQTNGLIGNDGADAGASIAGAAFDASTPALIFSLLTAWYLLRQQTEGNNCGTISMSLIMAGGIASILGEVSANVFYRARIRDIVKAYRDGTHTGAEYQNDTEVETITEDHTTQIDHAQIAAFSYLIDQEDARKTAAIIRSVAYGTGGGLYTAAAIAAAIETASLSGGTESTCNFTTDSRKHSNLFNDAIANNVFNGVAALGGLGGSMLTEGVANTITDDGGPNNSDSDDESPQDKDTFYNSIDLKNQKNGIEEIDLLKQIRMSLPKELVAKNEIKHPFYNMYDLVIDDSTYDMRKISGFNFKYQEANEIERFEIIKRFMHYFIPEAIAGSLDRTGEILDENNKVRRNVDVGVDIILEVVQLIAKVMMWLGVINFVNSIADTDKALDNIFRFPVGRGVTAGLLAGYSFIIMGISIDQVVDADKNITAITEIRDNFAAGPGSSLDHCQNRDDPADPLCYCFTMNGRNESRSNSEICKVVWGDGGIPDPHTWGKLANTSTTTGNTCVTADNKVHVGGKCPCRRNSSGSKSGSNSCASIRFGGSVPNVGAMSMFGGMANDANNGLAGNLSASDIAAAGQRTNNAIKMLNKMKKDKKYGPILAKMKKGESKLINDFIKKSPLFKTKRSVASAASAAPLPNLKNPESLKKLIDSNLKNNELEFNRAPPAATAAKKNDDFNFDFGGNNTDGITSEDQLADAMNSEYKFDDINNNSGASIFQILSIRYQKTGMRRLFEEEKAANTK